MFALYFKCAFFNSSDTRPSTGEMGLAAGAVGWRPGIEGSEMDTDDEIDLARAQIEERQNTPGASEADEDRPGKFSRSKFFKICGGLAGPRRRCYFLRSSLQRRELDLRQTVRLSASFEKAGL